MKPIKIRAHAHSNNDKTLHVINARTKTFDPSFLSPPKKTNIVKSSPTATACPQQVKRKKDKKIGSKKQEQEQEQEKMRKNKNQDETRNTKMKKTKTKKNFPPQPINAAKPHVHVSKPHQQALPATQADHSKKKRHGRENAVRGHFHGNT